MNKRVLRRPKRTPREDQIHTMRLGLIAFACLLLLLPWLFSSI